MSTPIDVSEEAGVRYLHFGSHWIQGAMRIARPWALELDYTRDMMLPLLLRGRSWPRKALVIGLGAASIPKFMLRHRPRAHLHIVEIDPRVIAAARQFFKLPPDDPPRLAIEVGDGDDFVARTRSEFDLVVVDGYDAKGRAGALDTERFYLGARRILNARGVLVVNLLGRSRGYRASVARIAHAFDDRVALVKSETGNVVVFAGAGDEIDLSFRELREAAAALRRDTGLNLLPAIAHLTGWKSAPGDRLVL